MNKQAKLITALAVVMAALMLLVPLAQTDLGGGTANDADDSIILSENTSEKIYYVNGTGSDSNAGTEGAPYQTIGKALGQSDVTKVVLLSNITEENVTIGKSVVIDGTKDDTGCYSLTGKVTINASDKIDVEIKNVDLKHANYIAKSTNLTANDIGYKVSGSSGSLNLTITNGSIWVIMWECMLILPMLV